MCTFFQNRYLPELINEDDMYVEDFLKASQTLPEFFDMLGAAMKLCKKDVEGNIRKVRQGHEALNGSANTLRQVLEAEQKSGVCKMDPSASIGLLWFKRTLEFVFEVLLALIQEWKHPEGTRDSVADAVRLGYQKSLMKHHNFLMKKTFQLGSYMSPRRTFINKRLSNDTDGLEDVLYCDMENFVERLRPQVALVNQMLIKFGVEEF